MYAVVLFVIPLVLLFTLSGAYRNSSENRRSRRKRAAAIEYARQALIVQMCRANETAASLLANEVSADIAAYVWRNYHYDWQRTQELTHAQALFTRFIMLIMTQRQSDELALNLRHVKRRDARLFTQEHARRGADIDTLYRKLKRMGVSVDRYERDYANS